MAKVPAELSRQRERDAWRLRCQGWTQVRIADHLEVTQQAVDLMLSRVETRLAIEFKEQAAQFKARQTAVLEGVLEEALDQWRRSCEDAVTEVTVKGTVRGKAEASGKKGAPKDESRAQVTRTVEGQTGNPALLAQARGAMADIREIWGLDAPKKNEHSGPEGGPIQFEQAAAAFDHRVAALTTRAGEDGDPVDPDAADEGSPPL